MSVALPKKLRTFQVGDLYDIRKDEFGIKVLDRVRVQSITNLFVRFESILRGKVCYSGNLLRISEPTCQGCDINGFDMIFSYDKIETDYPIKSENKHEN